jgi:tRNA A-37 threonylcarbamoyl transferase component Bud32
VKIDDKTLGQIMKTSEMHSMALASKFEDYPKGSTIVRQGEPGDAFYMIETGEVDVYIKEKGNSPLVTLKSGDFFGEKALLSSAVRTATCVAATNVKCMLLMREDFVSMLGNMADLIARSYKDHAIDDSNRSDDSGQIVMGDHPTGDKFVKSDFDIKRTLGVGAYGYVKLVKWRHAPKGNDQYYALKCISREKIEEKRQQKKIKREEDIMKALVHPFIARCYTVMEDKKGKYFLMEALCGGELCEMLYFESKFPENWTMFYAASVLTALAHMHERKIAYRDLKTENLVLDEAGYVKVVDFGLAKKITSGQTYTFCGTPDYLAPEVILNEGYDWGVDYWGLGVLIYEMAAGVAPFYAENPMDVSTSISLPCHLLSHYRLINSFVCHLSHNLADL